MIAGRDAARVGRDVRARLDAEERAAGFVGDPDDPARADFVADVLRPGAPRPDPDAPTSSR